VKTPDIRVYPLTLLFQQLSPKPLKTNDYAKTKFIHVCVKKRVAAGYKGFVVKILARFPT